jgi:hypothetical protein
MRTALAWIALAASLSGIAARGDDAPPAAPHAPSPRLAFAEKEFNFGKQVIGSKIEHVYRFKNEGDADLIIRRVKPSCGCTAALLSSERIPPGGAGEIKVTFASGDRQGFQDVQVHVFSNDAQEKDLGENVTVLHLRGEVANLLQVLPPSAYFASFLHGTRQEKKVTVLPLDVAAIEPSSIETTAPCVRARWAPFERSGRKGFAVSIEVAPDAPIGRLDAKVVVRTDHPKQPVLVIPVFGTIHGKFSVFPDRLMLFAQDLAEHEPSIFVLRVAGDADGPLPIEAVETPPPLAAEVVEIVPGKRAEIRLKLKPGAPRGPFAGVVRVFMRDAEQPLQQVLVLGEAPPKVTVEPAALWLELPGEPPAVRVSGGNVVGAAVEGAPLEATSAGGSIALKLAAGAKPGPFAGALVIRTDVAGEERVEVPLRGIVR